MRNIFLFIARFSNLLFFLVLQVLALSMLFLASDDSQMITAQDFVVDGGWAH